MSDTEPDLSATQSDFALPLVIAVTGHRDLVAAEIPPLGARYLTESWVIGHCQKRSLFFLLTIQFGNSMTHECSQHF